MKRAALAIVSASLICAVTGCELVTLKGAQVTDAVIENGGEWPFKPALMRVHPFTSLRFDESVGTHVISAHVEFRDRVNDVTKAVGSFRFELYRVTEHGGASSVSRHLLYQWSASVQTIDENVAHYDRATRTYEFKLSLDQPPEPGSRLLLLVQFTDADRHRFWAEGELVVPKPGDAPVN